MPKPNYKYEKRQKEIAKQKKKAEKLRRKLEKQADEVEKETAIENVDENTNQPDPVATEETNKE